jgi:hypothetical protein
MSKLDAQQKDLRAPTDDADASPHVGESATGPRPGLAHHTFQHRDTRSLRLPNVASSA